MAPACIAKEFGSVEGEERGGVLQHPEGLAAAHIVEVGVAADIHEDFFQHWHGLNTSGSWVENKAAESSGGGGGGGGDTTDYSQLTNLPTINGKVLTGDVTSKQLGLEDDVEYQAEGENLVLFKVPPTDGGN